MHGRCLPLIPTPRKRYLVVPICPNKCLSIFRQAQGLPARHPGAGSVPHHIPRPHPLQPTLCDAVYPLQAVDPAAAGVCRAAAPPGPRHPCPVGRRGSGVAVAARRRGRGYGAMAYATHASWLAQFESDDRDFRFMATSDLLNELKKPTLPADEAMQGKVGGDQGGPCRHPSGRAAPLAAAARQCWPARGARRPLTRSLARCRPLTRPSALCSNWSSAACPPARARSPRYTPRSCRRRCSSCCEIRRQRCRAWP